MQVIRNVCVLLANRRVGGQTLKMMLPVLYTHFTPRELLAKESLWFYCMPAPFSSLS